VKGFSLVHGMPSFWRNILHLSSCYLKMEEACSSETSVEQTIRFHIPEDSKHLYRISLWKTYLFFMYCIEECFNLLLFVYFRKAIDFKSMGSEVLHLIN
jgi:hypothetical protein